MALSVNQRALRLAKEMEARTEELKIKVAEAPCGAKILDCGVGAPGSLEAGVYVARICTGDLAEISLGNMDYDGLSLPAINVSTDYPAVETMGCQLADWEINVGGYYALGSGPARALAPDRRLPRGVALREAEYRARGLSIRRPREIYEEINYWDSSDAAVIVLESSALPPNEALTHVAEKCGVKPANLYAVVTPTSSVAGSTQIAARVVEVGVHKLGLLGLNFDSFVFGSGQAPIPPPHPKLEAAMGRVNDAIRFAGLTFYLVKGKGDGELDSLTRKVPSCNTENYGKLFLEAFKEAGRKFYSIELTFFSPAVATLSSAETGATFSSGKVNPVMLKRALGP
ncbi:TPA: methenyltetrahydromethanopterin cyclohydrolase [Candidatus Bathyarchaeota archaeon]|nr:methenyltetrahydromethanopterin cyclohydrolase [Candidatus Bathyarchaeota archaeon]